MKTAASRRCLPPTSSRIVRGLAGLCAVLGIAAVAGAAPSVDPRSTGGGDCAKNAYNCLGAANPLPVAKTVWLQEMTWMDLRDVIAHGTRTVILATGGVEPNGPWAALGKHNYIMQVNCEAIARKLGDALCAPLVSYVTSGGPERGIGTLGISKETFESLVSDIAKALQSQGFTYIALMGDHGGTNQSSLQAVADTLNKEGGPAHVLYVADYYKSWDGSDALLVEKGIARKGVDDGLHDDPDVTLQMMLTDPALVRYRERVKIGKTSINGVSIADRKKDLQVGRMLVDYRAGVTAAAIQKAIAAVEGKP